MKNRPEKIERENRKAGNLPQGISRNFLLLLAVAFAGCKSIGVDLGTQQPLKVDIAMKLDVYQHGDASTAAKKGSAPAADVATTRRNRIAEVQALKDQRLVGENHAGYLEPRNTPPGNFGEYLRQTVDDENADRARLIERLAKERSVTVAEAERQQAEIFRKSAFKGEWIEVPDAEGKFAWKQKE